MTLSTTFRLGPQILTVEEGLTMNVRGAVCCDCGHPVRLHRASVDGRMQSHVEHMPGAPATCKLTDRRRRSVGLATAVGIALVFLAGCTTPRDARDDLRAHVQEMCGVPAKDLDNVDKYVTCVYATLDIDAQADGIIEPMGGDD